jgi:membrane associated rhomboid family serine protease
LLDKSPFNAKKVKLKPTDEVIDQQVVALLPDKKAAAIELLREKTGLSQEECKAKIDPLMAMLESASNYRSYLRLCRPRITIVITNLEEMIWHLNLLRCEASRLGLHESLAELAGNTANTARALLSRSDIKKTELVPIATALINLARVKITVESASKLEAVCLELEHLLQLKTLINRDYVSIYNLKPLDAFWRPIKTNFWIAVPCDLLGLKSYYFQAGHDIPAGSKSMHVQFSTGEKIDWVFYIFLISLCFSFCLFRLDAINHSSALRQALISALDWTTAYMPLTAKPWTPLTCMWVHGSLWHLAANVSAFLLAGYWLSRAYGNKAWRWFCMIGGYIGVVVNCLGQNVPPADFTNWHGHSLVSLYSQPDSPLAGASGGAMAMTGAATAAALIYWIKRNKGAVNPMGIGLFFLIGVMILQMFYDAGDPGIAGLAHQGSWIAGFILGLMVPVRNLPELVVSNAQIAKVKKATYQMFGKTLVSLGLEIAPEFDQDKDFIAVKQSSVTGKGGPQVHVLAGSFVITSECTRLDVPIKRVPLALKSRISGLGIIAFFWWWFANSHMVGGGTRTLDITLFIFGMLFSFGETFFGSSSYVLQPTVQSYDTVPAPKPLQ